MERKEVMERKREDRRTQMTKRMLRDNLLELLEHQNIQKISVRALCEQADINRSTFYKYYKSQYDLLKGVSFSDDLLGKRSAKDREKLRTWTFYQFEQDLMYKAQASGSQVLKVKPDYTSQRCPKCGRIQKGNRHHDIHEYICDCCGYRSNDDRVGAMNIQLLGTMYVSGDSNPRFGVRKVN